MKQTPLCTLMFLMLAGCPLWAHSARADALELPQIGVEAFEKYLLRSVVPVPPTTGEAAAEKPPASARSKSINYRVALRKEPQELSLQDIKQMVLKYNFYDKFENPGGHFENDLIDNRDGSVTDQVTGLMWMKSVMRCCSMADIEQYMSSLNIMNHGRGFRGYDDWRVPTTEEMASLLEYSRLNKSDYQGTLFDAKKGSYFSADIIEDINMPWIVFFEGGYIGTGGNSACHYVRPVRSTF